MIASRDPSGDQAALCTWRLSGVTIAPSPDSTSTTQSRPKRSSWSMNRSSDPFSSARFRSAGFGSAAMTASRPPSGLQAKKPTPPSSAVTGTASPPSVLILWTWTAPPRFERKPIHLPSGENFGEYSFAGPKAKRLGPRLPSASTTQISACARLSPIEVSGGSWTTYAIQPPSGEIAGAAAVRSSSRSEAVKQSAPSKAGAIGNSMTNIENSNIYSIRRIDSSIQ